MTVSANNLEDEARDTAVTAMCLLWFVLSACVLLVRVWTTCMKRGSRPTSVSFYLGHLARSCRTSILLVTDSDGGPVAKQVADELMKRRLTRARNWIPYGASMSWLVVGVVFVRTRVPGPRQNSFVQDVAIFIGCFTMLALRAFPRAVTLRTLDFWSSILSGTIALWLSPFAMQGDVVTVSLLMPFGFMILTTLFNLNLKLNIFWLIVVTMSACSTILFGSSDYLPSDVCSLTRPQNVTHVITSAAMFATIVIAFHHAISKVVQYEIEANISRNELVAARSVLRCVCDVVVELDCDFRLQDESPQLIDMLLLNPQRSLLGEDLRSFLASQQDHQKFSEQMSQTRDDAAELSAAFHVSMKDSSSVPLIVEVFSVRFVNREGQAAYFVGIREFTDTNPMMGGATVLPEVQLHGGRRGDSPGAPWSGLPHPVPALPAGDIDTDGSSKESSDINSQALSWTDEDLVEDASQQIGGLEEPLAWIDVLSSGYTIKHATRGFSQHVLAGDGEFLVAVRPSKRADFIAWAQEAYFELLELEEALGSTVKQYTERLHLKSKSAKRTPGVPRSKERTRKMVSATVRIDLTPLPSEQQEQEGSGIVRIVLHDLQIVRGGPKERSPQRLTLTGTPSAIASGQLREQDTSQDPGGTAPPETTKL